MGKLNLSLFLEVLTCNRIPCERLFIAHYEHILADPAAYRAPFAEFLELGANEREILNTRLSKKGRLPPRKAHKLTQYAECQQARLSEEDCYNMVRFYIYFQL